MPIFNEIHQEYTTIWLSIIVIIKIYRIIRVRDMYMMEYLLFLRKS